MADRDGEYVEFVGASSAALRRTAYLVCGDWHRADDVVQDALYKLYLVWAKLDTRTPFAYARRIVVNAALDTRRRPWRRETPTDRVPERDWAEDHTGVHAEQDELRRALAELAPRQRACVVLRYYEDLSIEQTAEILNCSQGTVKSQAARGLETLRLVIDRTRSNGRAS